MYFSLLFFFFNDTATTEIYTLSLHDALPISRRATGTADPRAAPRARCGRLPGHGGATHGRGTRSEEHTSELQSQSNIVCRLLLGKKKTKPALPENDTRSQPTAPTRTFHHPNG